MVMPDHSSRGGGSGTCSDIVTILDVAAPWAGLGRLRHHRVIAVVVGAAVTGLLLTRLLVTGDALDRVWAEDGAVYLAEFTRHGLASLGYAYAGYLQVPSRLIVLVGLALPLRDFGAWCVVSSSVVTGLLATFSFLVARRMTGSSIWAAVAGLSMALVPALSLESLGALANLQWFLIPAAGWALLLPPRPGATLRAGAVTVALAAALASPLAVFVLPAALVNGRRTLRAWPVWALLVGLVCQALAARFAPASRPPSPRAWHLSAQDIKPMLRGLLGPGVRPGQHLLTWLVVVMVVTVVAAIVFSGSRSAAAGLMLASAFAFYVSSSFANGHATPRYAGCASMLLAGAFALQAPAARPLTAVSALMVPVGLAVLSFPAQPYRLSGPSWSQSVRQAQHACQQRSTYVAGALVSPVHFGAARLVCRSQLLHF